MQTGFCSCCGPCILWKLGYARLRVTTDEYGIMSLIDNQIILLSETNAKLEKEL